MLYQSQDSPVRRSSTQVTASGAPTRATKVMEAVKKDLNRNILLVPPDLFLDRLLSQHIGVIDTVVAEVMNKFYSQKTRRWKDFPIDYRTHEDVFYPQIVKLANHINKQANELPNTTTDRAVGSWVDCHSKTPNANADFVAEIRPDCAYVANAEVVTDAITDSKHFDSKSEEHNSVEPKIWWRQMILAIEVKREDGGTLYSGAFPQLCTYIRQMLRQQLDRRFAFGITISFNKIAMWLCDRSGGMGMSKAYNIHEEPGTFVRMICAITLLPSHRIGWDPTLKLYSKALGGFVPSYKIRAALKPESKIETDLSTTSKTNDDVSNSLWLLTVVDDRDDMVKEHKMILAKRPLLIRTSEGMNGRAVQVHQAYKEEDHNKMKRQPLVIKTSWQPIEKTDQNSFHEERMYNKVDKLKNRIVAASVVKVGHGLENNTDNTPVSTFNFVRQGLHKEADFSAGVEMNANVKKLSTYQRKVSKNGQLTLNDKQRLDEMKETMAYMAFNEPGFTDNHVYFAEEDSLLTDRVQTRLILNIWGWPINFFKDLRELLKVIRGAVADHQTMFQAGVLHRDVSAGNVVIRPALPNFNLPVRELVTKTSGVLIDLDHAKDTDLWRNPTKPASNKFHLTKPLSDVCNVTEDTILQASKFFPDLADVPGYCKAATTSDVLGSTPNGRWSPKDLGWGDIGMVPDYSGHVPSVNERTGTIPFISHKLMVKNKRVVHHAIHDMESFWWILIHICLTRKAGGGQRQEGLTKEFEDQIDSLFDSSNDAEIGITKISYFDRTHGQAAFDDLLNLFPKYFEKLKPMLRRWRKVLDLGYTYEAYEYHLVHTYVLAIIDGTLGRLRGDNPSDDIEEHLKQRDIGYAYICNIELPNGVTPPQPILVPPAGFSPLRNQATAQASSSTSIPEPPASPTLLPLQKRRKH